MIDFVSTRETTDPQTAACCRLLAAVIAQAVADACSSLTPQEKEAHKNIESDARGAIEFLFGDRPTFDGYAKLIGLPTQAFRDALLQTDGVEAIVPLRNRINSTQRRHLRVRHQFWMDERFH